MRPLKVYACYNLEQKIRLSSSSGGIFSVLSEYVLSAEGVIYGVAMSEDCYSAEFIRVTHENELAKLRGSKYLQAKLGDTYKLVKNDLLVGKKVLFTGTGCQVNGLKKYLGEEYENLICIDVICHGTPSPVLWKKYVEHQEMKQGGKLMNISFRCKDKGWENFGMKEVFVTSSEKCEKNIYISKDDDSYMQMFLRDECLRPSCYECVAKNEKMSDVTIADFWGINNIVKEMNDGKGISLVLVRTKKGNDIFEKISKEMKLQEVSYEDSIVFNPAEYQSCKRPALRDTFFEDMYNMTFEELEKKYAAVIKISSNKIISGRIKHIIKRILGIMFTRRNRT